MTDRDLTLGEAEAYRRALRDAAAVCRAGAAGARLGGALDNADKGIDTMCATAYAAGAAAMREAAAAYAGTVLHEMGRNAHAIPAGIRALPLPDAAQAPPS